MMDPFRQQMYDDIVDIAIQNGCTVVSKCYVNAHDMMKFLCPNGHPRIVKPGFFRRSPLGCGLCPNKKLLKSRDEFIRIVIEKYNGTVVGEYKGNDMKVECLCENGHKCFPSPRNIKAGQGICLICAGQSSEEAKKRFIESIEQVGGKVVGEYRGNKISVDCICKNDHKCFPIPSSIQQGKGMCKKCVGQCSEEAELNFIHSIEKLGGQVIEQYVNAHTPVKCICNNNHVCYPYPTAIQKGLGMCLTCAGQNPLEVEKKFRKFVAQKGGTVIGKYCGSKTPIYCKCILDHDCYPTPEALQYYGRFCVTCTKIEKESYGEKLISIALTTLNIKYEREVTPKELKKLRFDFKFEYDNRVWYVEYDGGQHQKYNVHYHKSEAHFLKCRHRDLLKNYFITNSQNCVLIRLDHSWEKNKHLKKQNIVGEKLIEYFQSCFSNNDEKIFYNLNMYDWINDKPDEETINKYLV